MNQIYLSIPMGVNDENGIEESPALLLAIDVCLIKAFQARIQQVKLLRAGDSDVFSVTRHAWGLQVYDRNRVSDLFEDLDLYGESSVELTEEQYTLIKTEEEKGDTMGFAEERGAAVRVDCRQEHYLDDGVYFTALVKHTSIELESQGLGDDTLARYLDQLNATEQERK